ncbi:MAG: hypothetical protein ACK557_04530, partial [Planctomycetota bacterium]
MTGNQVESALSHSNAHRSFPSGPIAFIKPAETKMPQSIRIASLLAWLFLTASNTWAQTNSLQELGSRLTDENLPKITIYQAKEILTLDPTKPLANAVAVVGSRILAT